MALIDDFKNDPAAVKIPLVSILASRVQKQGDDDGWVVQDSHYKFEWRWAGTELPEIIQEIASDGSSESALSKVANPTVVDSTPGSWVYEATGEGNTGWVHVNQSSSAISDWCFEVQYYWRLTTHKDQRYKPASDWLVWHVALNSAPNIKRFTRVLASDISAATGSFEIKDSSINERLSRDTIYNRPVTIELVGSTRGTPLPYGDRIMDFEGFATTKGGGGNLKGRVIEDKITIQITDGTALLEKVESQSSTVPFTGRVDQIIAALVSGLSVDSGFAAARPYDCRIFRPSPQTINRIIEMLTVHLANFFYRRDGTPYLTYWQAPTGSGAVATFKEWTGVIYPKLTNTLEFSNYADVVKVIMSSGWKGTKMLETRAEKEDQERDVLRVAQGGGSGWTAHVGFNFWTRTDLQAKPVDVRRNNLGLVSVGSMSQCNNDDDSWAYLPNAITGVPTLFVNPQGGGPASAWSWEIYFEREKQRNTTSLAVTGQDDTNEQSATDLLGPIIYDRQQEKVINSCVEKKADALQLAEDYLEFTKVPMEIWELSTVLPAALDIDIMDEVDIIRKDGSIVSVVTIGTLSDYNAGVLKFWGWRPHQGIPT